MILPKVINVKNIQKLKNIEISLSIPHDIIFFEGHFQNYPVLAGVVQVDWVIHFAKQYFSLNKIQITNIDQLKFTQVILPNSQIMLNILIENQNILFKYYTNNTAFSSGKIIYK